MEAINMYPELQQPNKQGLAPVVIRFDIKGKHIATDKPNIKIPPAYWDAKTKRVKNGYTNAALINSTLTNVLQRHETFILKRQVFGLPLTVDILKKYLKSKSVFESFYTYAENVLANKKLKDGLPYSEDSKRRYNDEIKRMMQYSPTLSFNELNASFLTSYKLWLQNTYRKKDGKLLDKNSIWKALSFIRMVYNEAIKEQVILPDENPFKTFKVGAYEENNDKVKFLDLGGIDKLENLLLTKIDLPVRMANVGWRFLCMCVSGLRISDAMQLNEAFFNDIGDLEFKPHKTRRHSNVAKVPITTPRQKRYFEKALRGKLPGTDPKNFRTTFNNDLKVLAALAGLRLDITSHTGRHTMGSFLVDAGIETKPAKAILGVKSNEVINRYMHLKDAKLRSEGEKFNNVM